MWKLLGLILWWACLKGADMLVESLFEAVPLWLRIAVVVGLGLAAIPLTFSREIRKWRGSGRSAAAPDRAGAELPDLASEEPQENNRSTLDDREAVRLNPGNGRRVVRLIMNAATEEEVEDLYGDFKSAPHRTSEIDVFAAYSLKMVRLMGQSDDDGETEEDWWFSFYAEAEELGAPEEAASAIERLEEEFPDD